MEEIEIKELLALCKSKKLKDLIKIIYDESIIKGIEFDIYDMGYVLFDIETKEDFGKDIISYFQIGLYSNTKKEKNDGWLDYDIHSEFAKLLIGFKWENVTLKNGKILIICYTDECIKVLIFDFNNLYDGAIVQRSLFPNVFYKVNQNYLAKQYRLSRNLNYMTKVN